MDSSEPMDGPAQHPSGPCSPTTRRSACCGCLPLFGSTWGGQSQQAPPPLAQPPGAAIEAPYSDGGVQPHSPCSRFHSAVSILWPDGPGLGGQREASLDLMEGASQQCEGGRDWPEAASTAAAPAAAAQSAGLHVPCTASRSMSSGSDSSGPGETTIPDTPLPWLAVPQTSHSEGPDPCHKPCASPDSRHSSDPGSSRPSPIGTSPGSSHSGCQASSNSSSSRCSPGRSSPLGCAAEITRETVAAQVSEVLRSHGALPAHDALLDACSRAGLDPGSRDVEKALAACAVDLQALVQCATRLRMCLAEASSFCGWKLMVGSDNKDKGTSPGGMDVWYRHDNGSLEHSFRAVTTMDAPLEHVLAVCAEIDLAKTWCKYIQESKILSANTTPGSQTVGMVSVWAPWPISGMDFLAEVTTSNLLGREGDCFLAALATPARSAKAKGPDLLHDANPKHMKVRVADGSFLKLTPLAPASPGGPLRTAVVFSITVDIGVRDLPRLLITFVLQVLVPCLHKTAVELLEEAFYPSGAKQQKGDDAKKRTRSAHPPFLQRLQDNDEVYRPYRDAARKLA